jgi:hypothetical protein
MIAATALIFSDASRPRDGTDNPARRAHDARPEGGHPHAIRHRRRVDNGLVVAQVAVDSERSTPFSHVAESSLCGGTSADRLQSALTRASTCNYWAGTWGDRCMTDELSPAFHAEIILELFNEFRCVRKVGQRAGVLLSSYSHEHLEAISRHLPKELVQVLPRRQLRAA